MTSKPACPATTKLGLLISCSLIYLSTLTGCSSNMTSPVENGGAVAVKPEQTQDQDVLSLTPDALELPPTLQFEQEEVRSFAVDWKHPNGAVDRLQEDLEVPNVRATDGSLELLINGTIQPVSLVLSIYRTNIGDIDPTEDPDLVVDCLISDSQCAFAMSGGNTGALRIYQLEDEEMVMSLQAEYYAEPSLNAERFVNTIGWIFSVN